MILFQYILHGPIYHGEKSGHFASGSSEHVHVDNFF